MEVVAFIFGVVTAAASIVFLVHQAVEYGRTPLAIFVSPITNKECKILCQFIENQPLKRDDKINDKVYVIGDYRIVKHYVTDKWTINGVQLSYFHERAVLKALTRNALKAHMLTATGQVLFSK